MIKVLTQEDINKVEIDEGVVVINMGEATGEVVLGPTRGGATFTATPSIRDIDFDGRRGKTKGLQVKDGEDVKIAIKTLCCSLENLKLAIPNGTTADSSLTPGVFGLIPGTAYLKNVAVVTKMLDGTYTAIKVENAMHEGEFKYECKSKSENEHNLEFVGHYNALATTDETIWNITTSAINPLTGVK